MHVPSGWLNSIAFLYPDTHSAESDQHGSTGFFVSHPAEDPALAPASYTYLVTNSHVAFEGACSYARINAVDGGTRLVDLRAQDWFHHPAGDDVAIMPITPDASWSFTRIETSYLLTEHEAAHWGFGPGDEAFFFGRYQPLSGSTTNRPVVRFGRVAAFLPYQPSMVVLEPRKRASSSKVDR